MDVETLRIAVFVMAVSMIVFCVVGFGLDAKVKRQEAALRDLERRVGTLEDLRRQEAPPAGRQFSDAQIHLVVSEEAKRRGWL